MEVNYADGKISFHLCDALEQVSLETKREFMESFSCDEDVIDFVSQQIISGRTESGYYGSTISPADHDPCTALDRAKRAVAKASGDVAKREIERLEDALRRARNEIDNLHAELRDHRRDW